jgi:hypothetical protein
MQMYDKFSLLVLDRTSKTATTPMVLHKVRISFIHLFYLHLMACYCLMKNVL